MKRTLQSSLTFQRELLDETKTICQLCFNVCDSKLVVENGKVFLEKDCCKPRKILVENDVEYYKKFELPFKWNLYNDIDNFNIKSEKDLFNYVNQKRGTNYSFITVTPHCNIGCPICYQRFSIFTNQTFLNSANLSLDEIKRHVKQFKGKRLVSLIGGEPTLRHDLPDIIKLLKRYGHVVGLITFGQKLLNEDYVKDLKKSGLDFVCLSFDGLNEQTYLTLRGANYLPAKLMILKNLQKHKLYTYFVSVIRNGLNDNQVGELIRFATYCNNFVKGVFFQCLEEENDNYDDKTTPSNIIRQLEKYANISFEYFLEEKKFRYNLFQLVYRVFGDRFVEKLQPLVRQMIYLRVEGKGVFKPLVKLEEYKRMNQILEESIIKKTKSLTFLNSLKLMKYFINGGMKELLIAGLLSSFDMNKASTILFKRNILKIQTRRLYMLDSVDIKRNDFMNELKSDINGMIVTYT